MGQQQARLHARYVFARLLQRVDGFDLAPECQPHGTLPRTAAWLAKEGADGRHGKERIWPAATITLHAKVWKNSAISRKMALTAFSRAGCGLEYDGRSDGCEILHVLASIQAALGQQGRQKRAREDTQLPKRYSLLASLLNVSSDAMLIDFPLRSCL